jgi:hypothetical protein
MSQNVLTLDDVMQKHELGKEACVSRQQHTLPFTGRRRAVGCVLATMVYCPRLIPILGAAKTGVLQEDILADLQVVQVPQVCSWAG